MGKPKNRLLASVARAEERELYISILTKTIDLGSYDPVYPLFKRCCLMLL